MHSYQQSWDVPLRGSAAKSSASKDRRNRQGSALHSQGTAIFQAYVLDLLHVTVKVDWWNYLTLTSSPVCLCFVVQQQSSGAGRY